MQTVNWNNKHTLLIVVAALIGAAQAVASVQPEWAGDLHAASGLLTMVLGWLGLASPQAISRTPPPDVPKGPGGTGFGTLSTLAFMVLGVAGCPNGDAVAPVANLGACILGVDAEEPANTPILQIVADCLMRCGGDIPSILNALVQEHADNPARMAEISAARAEFAHDPAAYEVKVKGAVRR